MNSPVLTSHVLPVVRIDESLSPSPLEVLQWPCRVMRHVPKCARLLWCQNLTSAIHNFVSTPSTVSLAKLFMLPKVLLVESGRGGKRAKRAHGCHIIQMMQRWADGEWLSLWAELKDSSSVCSVPHQTLGPAQDPDDELPRLRRRILKLLQDQGLSKAARELSSQGIHTATPEVLKKLTELHPAGLPSDVDLADAACVWPGLGDTDEEAELKLRRIIMSFPAGSAGGPSKLLPDHLKEAMSCGSALLADALLSTLHHFVDICARGELPLDTAEFFTAATLVPLKKGDIGTGVRPIAVGEVLRRIVESAILQEVQDDCVSSLKPLQVGVGIRDATTQIARLCSLQLPSLSMDQTVGMLQIDMVNAFNTLSRACILRQVKRHAPQAYRWALWSLSHRSVLVCQNSLVYGQAGVQQGSLNLFAQQF